MSGIILGYNVGGHRSILYNRPAHLVTIAKTGGGKNTSVIMPNLLSNEFDGTKIILDLKGENAAVCSYWKEKQGVGKAFRLNPWNIFDMGTIKFNPFALLDAESDRLFGDCKAFAEAIIPERVGNDTAEHFDKLARKFISGFLFYFTIKNAPQTPNPADLYDELVFRTVSSDALKETIDEMSEFKHEDRHVNRTIKLAAMSMETLTISSGSGKGSGEFRSMKTTLENALECFENKILAQSVEADIEQSRELIDSLFHDKTGCNDLYISFPQDEIKNSRVWLRLVLTALIRDNVARRPKRPVLFILDEFPQLGTFSMLKEASAFLRGSNVRFWYFGQAISQFRENYGADGMQTILQNCDVHQYFNVSGETAEMVSKKIGMNKSVSRDMRTMEFKNINKEEIMSPQEVERFKNILNFVGGHPYFVTEKIPYFANIDMEILAMPNPMFHGLQAFKNHIKE